VQGVDESDVLQFRASTLIQVGGRVDGPLKEELEVVDEGFAVQVTGSGIVEDLTV
jgi:hypothetical protein